MEEQSVFESPLNINEQIRGYLKETSGWTFFLAILAFIGVAFMLLAGLVVAAMAGSLPEETNPYSQFGFSMSWLGIFYIIMAIVMIFPALYLFNFSRKTKTALESSRIEDFTSSFSNLKSYFKFTGIMAIVVIVLYIIGIIAMLSFGASMAGSGAF